MTFRKRLTQLLAALCLVVIASNGNSTFADIKPIPHKYSDYYAGYVLSNSKATKPIEAYAVYDEGILQVRDMVNFRTLFDCSIEGELASLETVLYDFGLLIAEYMKKEDTGTDYKNYRFVDFNSNEFDFGEDIFAHIIYSNDPIYIYFELQDVSDKTKWPIKYSLCALQDNEIIWKIEDLTPMQVQGFNDNYFWIIRGNKFDIHNTKTGEKRKSIDMPGDNASISMTSNQITEIRYDSPEIAPYKKIEFCYIDNKTFEVFYTLKGLYAYNHRGIKRTIIDDKLCIATPDFETYEPGSLTINVKVVTPDEGVALDNDILLEGVHLINNELPSGTLIQKRIADVSDKYLLFIRGDLDELQIIDIKNGITKARIKASGVGDGGTSQGYIKDDLVFFQTRYQYLCYDISKDRMLWQINRNPIWNYVEYEGLGYYIYFHDKHNKNLPNCEVKVYDLKHDKQEPYSYSFDGYVSKECVVPTRYGVVVIDVYREDGYYIELYKPGVSEPVYSVKSSTICTNYLKNVKLTEDGAYIELFYSFNNHEGPTKYSYFLQVDTGLLLYELELSEQKRVRFHELP